MTTITARYAVQFQTEYDNPRQRLEACRALMILIARIDPGLIVHLTQIDDEVLELPELQS